MRTFATPVSVWYGSAMLIEQLKSVAAELDDAVPDGSTPPVRMVSRNVVSLAAAVALATLVDTNAHIRVCGLPETSVSCVRRACRVIDLWNDVSALRAASVGLRGPILAVSYVPAGAGQRGCLRRDESPFDFGWS